MSFMDDREAYAYINQYQKDNYDRITLMARKGKKEKYKAAARSAGMSLSSFIQLCVDKQIGGMDDKL